ncbi:MAG: 16S rRNA (uracil(1498)-N(3))-methyltransferase [Alphaproteobacteria bacterium]
MARKDEGDHTRGDGDDVAMPLACATGRTRLFVAEDLTGGMSLTLGAEQSHYLASVLRARSGDAVLVFNGRDGEWAARVTSVGKRAVGLEIEGLRRPQDTVPDLTLLFAPVKRARLDFLVQKATELGVAAIGPVMTRRTVVGRVNTDRLTANVVEAAEQCGRLTVPQVLGPRKLDAVLAAWPPGPGARLLFCDEAGPEGGAPPALRALAGVREGRGAPWFVLIGPEGGFDGAEREALGRCPGALRVSLGPRIMRADTAAIAALTLWQAALGDFGTGGLCSFPTP